VIPPLDVPVLLVAKAESSSSTLGATRKDDEVIDRLGYVDEIAKSVRYR